MARVDNNRLFKGTIGPLVFRTQNGQQIVQTKAYKPKQTIATKESSSEFRHCSSWTKYLRLGLQGFLVNLTDSYMYRRFTGAFYNALQTYTALPKGQRTPLNSNLQSLAGFEFNTHSPFADYCKISFDCVLNATHDVTITIPEFIPKTDLLWPANADQAELVLYVYATSLENHTRDVTHFTVLPIAKINTPIPETTWTSPILPVGYFVVVCSKLLYYTPNAITTRNYLNSKTLNPSSIVFAGVVA